MFLPIFVVLHLGQLVQTNPPCIAERFEQVQQVYMGRVRETRENSSADCSVQCYMEQNCPAFTYSAGSCTLLNEVNDGSATCHQQHVYLNKASQHNGRPIRLVGGSYYGRLEVYYGSWGTVCDDSFSYVDAITVCKQLGLPSTNAEFRSSDYYGQGSGLILLDDVQCTGHETYLTQCCHRPWGFNDCTHAEDVGVICT